MLIINKINKIIILINKINKKNNNQKIKLEQCLHIQYAQIMILKKIIILIKNHQKLNNKKNNFNKNLILPLII